MPKSFFVRMGVIATLMHTSAIAEPTEAYDRLGNDIIPAILQGSWAANAKDCNDPDRIGVTNVYATAVEGYEFRAKVIKHAGFNSRSAISGKDGQYVTMLVAESGEGRVGFSRLLLGLVGERLYVDRPSDPIDQLGGKARINDKSAGLIRCSRLKR